MVCIIALALNMARSHRSSLGREGIVNQLGSCLPMSIKQITIAAVAALGLSVAAFSASAGAANENAGSPLTVLAAHNTGGGGGAHPGGGGGMHPGAGMHPGGGMHPGRGAMNRAGGGFDGRHAGDGGGRHGYWRGGHWYWGAPVVFRGGCYSTCLSRGFGPYYCRANAYRFCG